MADSCAHICSPISPTHSHGRPREFTAEEFQERRDQHNCSTSAPALASQNKIQQKEKRYYHREESLAEADTKIKNLKKPLKIFCDILKVSKTKVKFSSLRICQKNKQDVQKFAFSPPLLDSIHPLQICLQDIWSIPLPLPPLLWMIYIN